MSHDPLALYNAADPTCERCRGLGRLADELDADDRPAPCPCIDPDLLEPVPTITIADGPPTT